jgi:hypothetical protein
MKSYKDEDSGHDYLMDPGCRAVGRPPCTTSPKWVFVVRALVTVKGTGAAKDELNKM